ncbi:peptidase C14, caspase domain-containing protein [Armillaria luteobubalina]|uniref:Peptidase C14, caspase domain-containing protein n=1 Tax=Armillaria luteobubalina TaxID=153913 RepID=A0AA39UA80_9AGAR|nr:peptidase C14, caspase domain-containing protein [Armillaria luteobubalina]
MRGAPILVPPFSSVWAILIGIDGYKTDALGGCVSDGRLMEDYLTNHAAVKKTRIQRLLGPSGENAATPSDSLPPTRKNIIDTLQSLANNDRIMHGSDILIYYAGHGASYPGPAGTTETLCPIDRDAKTGCHDISDRQINEILYQISCRKGHRITVIFDCCYSGGTTRGNSNSHQEQFRFRGVPPLPDVSANSTLRTADEDLNLLGSDRSVLASGWRAIMDSHVILAACVDTEHAREKGNGVFTVALLEALKSNLLTRQSTYIDLLNALSVDGQKPVLAGKHKNSQLGDLKEILDPRY